MTDSYSTSWHDELEHVMFIKSKVSTSKCGLKTQNLRWSPVYGGSFEFPQSTYHQHVGHMINGL